MFFVKREHEVEDLLLKHFRLVGDTLEEFQKIIDIYLQKDPAFKADAHKVHEKEHQADIIRREIGRKLYQGAFLPIYREDYLLLIEMVDAIANMAETTISFLVLTRPQIPDFLLSELKELAQATVATYLPLKDALNFLSADSSKVMEVTRQVGELEQKVDILEWEAIKKVYKSDLSLAEKHHLRELISDIAEVSDLIEAAAERLDIMVVKRII